jgi:hypothetical protein
MSISSPGGVAEEPKSVAEMGTTMVFDCPHIDTRFLCVESGKQVRKCTIPGCTHQVEFPIYLGDYSPG